MGAAVLTEEHAGRAAAGRLLKIVGTQDLATQG